MNNKNFSRRAVTENPETGFAVPDQWYAPHAFWFWNGAFQKENIRSQAENFLKQRLNPGYIHARFWPYMALDFWLSDQWFELFRTALKETEKNDGFLSYTIGDPCFPDKKILSAHPELRARSLACDTMELCGNQEFNLPENAFCAVAAKVENGKILSSTLRVLKERKFSGPGRWRIFAYTVYEPEMQYRNSYIDDRLFPAWKTCEHDKYENAAGQYFGKTMRGVFVDQEGDWGGTIVWSETLEKIYAERHHRDIRQYLPLLAEEDAEGFYCAARWMWFDAVTHAYSRCFTEPMDRWCRDRGMYMTCHFWEGNLFHQAMAAGSYLHMQRSYSMPGNDALFRTVFDNPELFTETASVCEFEHRGFMSEIPGIAGWDLSPSELKKMMNRCIAWGVTQPVLHGINTSQDLARVSYPPDFYRINPYWSFFHNLSDFAARAFRLNDSGRLDAHVLMLCPMDSVWALTGGRVFDAGVRHHPEYEKSVELEGSPHRETIERIDRVYQEVSRALKFASVDFMTADKHYLERMQVSGSALEYEEFRFTVLILPPIPFLPRVITEKIYAFAMAGGRILALGELPDSSPEYGANDPVLKKRMEEVRKAPGFSDESADPLRAAQIPVPCAKCENGTILATRRIISGKPFVWLSNETGRVLESEFSFPGVAGGVKRWDCETGSVAGIPSGTDRNGTKVFLRLEPFEALFLSFGEEKCEPVPERKSVECMDLSRDWNLFIDMEKQIAHPHPAVIVLPYGITSTGFPLKNPVPWSEIEYEREKCLSEKPGLECFSGIVDYRKTFDFPNPDGTEVLELEHVLHCAGVFVNGQYAGDRMWPPFRFPIGRFLKRGENTVTVSVGNLIVNDLLAQSRVPVKFPQELPPGSEKRHSGLFGNIRITKAV